jgi:cell division protein FtsI/penicillin-binding protein 2
MATVFRGPAGVARVAVAAGRGGPARSASDRDFRLRALWLLAASLVLGLLIESRLVYWQAFERGLLRAEALSEHTATVTLPATRGQLLDRYGRPLAVNVTAYDVFVSPDQVPVSRREATAAQLGAATGVPAAQLLETLASGSKFAYVARNQSMEVADRLRAANLQGVGLEPVQRRSYLSGGVPGTTLAPNLLGFVNNDGAGQYGVEAHYQPQLAGKDGRVSSYRDLAGNEIAIGGVASTRVDPVNGEDLLLTIDADVQHAAEQALAEGVQKNKAESGSVIVMEPATGAIVAWADYPSYDANHFSTVPVNSFVDPVAGYLYEPGSTMKIVTLAGAIEAGKITPSSKIDDPGSITVGGVTLYDWDRTRKGTINYYRVLDSSLNVGAIKAMQAEGDDAFYRNLVSFGFGAASGVDVAGESSVPLRTLTDYRPSELATVSYGQGISVNMVQMCAAVNVIANGGRYAQPHVVERVGEQPAEAASVAARQVISATTAATMTDMMRDVVIHGSGSMARIPGFDKDEAGKTGTSQIPVDGKYSQDVWASYVGFMPASNPRFTILVVVRKPHNKDWINNDGWIVAAPIWKQIAQQIILDWHITPTPANPQNH